MRIGIIAAMEQEIQPLRRKLKQLVKKMGFTEPNIKDLNVYVVKSGIGKINAASATTELILKEKVDCIINYGLAGGLTKDVKIGDIIVAKNVRNFDFDLTIFDYEMGQTPNGPVKYKTKAIYTIENVKWGDILSADKFATKNDLPRVKKFFGSNVLAIDMEAVGVGQVCFKYGIPFYCLKVISDNLTQDNNKDSYEYKINENCEKISKKVYKLINEIW